MGKKGKSEWDAAMEATGHRVSKEKAKKWTSRLRTNTKNTMVVDMITREQILNERLEALERDNYEEEEYVNEADLYDEEEDDLTVHSRRRREVTKNKPLSTLPVLKFPKVVFQDKNSKEAIGLPSYVTAAAKSSKYPNRRFCSICGYKSNYKCAMCGSLYCSYMCKQRHEETKCINIK